MFKRTKTVHRIHPHYCNHVHGRNPSWLERLVGRLPWLELAILLLLSLILDLIVFAGVFVFVFRLVTAIASAMLSIFLVLLMVVGAWMLTKALMSSHSKKGGDNHDPR